MFRGHEDDFGTWLGSLHQTIFQLMVWFWYKKETRFIFSIISGFHEICDEKERSGQRKWKRNGFSSERNYKRTNGNIYGVKLSTVLSLKKSCLSVLFVFYPKHFLPSSEREKNTLKTEQLAGHSLLANDYKVSF